MKTALLALVVVVVISGIGAVYARHQSRILFGQLQQLQAQRDELNIEWGQLQLEQSTWAAHGRIEKLATEELNMYIPSHEDIVLVKP